MSNRPTREDDLRPLEHIMLYRVLPLVKKSLQLLSNPNLRQLLLTVLGINVIYDFSPLVHCGIILACITAGFFGDQILEKRRFKPLNVTEDTLSRLTQSTLSQLNYFKQHIDQMEQSEIPLALSLQFCADFLTFYQLGYYFIAPKLAWLYPVYGYLIMGACLITALFMSMKYRNEVTEKNYCEYRQLLEKTPPNPHIQNPINPLINFAFIIAFIATQYLCMNALSASISNYIKILAATIISPHVLVPIVLIGVLALYKGGYDYFKNAMLSLVFGYGMTSSLTFLTTHITNIILKYFKRPSLSGTSTLALTSTCIGVTLFYSLNSFQERNRQSIIAKLIRSEEASSNHSPNLVKL